MSLKILPIEPISVDPQRKTRFNSPNRTVANSGVRKRSLTAPRRLGKTRSRPIAKPILAAETIAACREARVPPSTATIITCFQKLPPIRSPTNARMFAEFACISEYGATPWNARTLIE